MSNRNKTFRHQSDGAPALVVRDRSRRRRKEALLVAGIVALGSLATLGAANRGGAATEPTFLGGGFSGVPSHSVGRRLLERETDRDARQNGRRRIGGARFDRVVYPPNDVAPGKERGTLRQLLADDYETGGGEGDASSSALEVSAEEETEEDVHREIAEEKEEEREIAEEAREERAEAREERRERREQRQEMREAVEEVKEEVAEEQEEEAEAEAEAEAEEAKEEQEEEAAEADSAEENEREEEEREEEQAAVEEE